MSNSQGAFQVSILLCKQLLHSQPFLSNKSSNPLTLTLIYNYTVHNSVLLRGNSLYEPHENLLHNFSYLQKKTDTHKKSLGLQSFQMQETVYETVIKEIVYRISLNFRLPIANTQKFLSAGLSTKYCRFSSRQDRHGP